VTLVRRLIALVAPLALAAVGVALALTACDARWTGDPGEALPTAPSESPAVRTHPPTRPPPLNAPRFAAGQLEQHFQKHGLAMGFANQVEYLRAAQALVRGGPGVETWQRADGDTLFFRAATGEFGVLSDRNILRTYFKPDDGPRYWARQHDK